MSGSGSETLTAALRRLADEHASGLLSVATPGRDVVLELADGTPVGIGPTHDVSGRVGREAGPGLVAAAVVDDLVDRTVAAIVGGGGEWTWDVSSDADMMPVPDGLAVELSRRAVDAAQALAALDPDQVLQQGRDLEATGEVGRIRALFDGERSIADVAAEADITVPACATVAAALVRAGALSTGMEDAGPPSWTDTVAGADHDDDEDDDEPELWVMDEPDEPEELEESDHAEPAPTRTWAAPSPARAEGAADAGEATAPAPRAEEHRAPAAEIDDAMEWVAGDDRTTDEDAGSAPTAAPPPAATTEVEDDDWDSTTWMDELDDASAVRPRDDAAAGDGGHEPDARTALSSMINDLQAGNGEVQRREQPPPAPTQEKDQPEESASGKRGADATRKEPKAEPGEVAEFLRELSRLALDDD